MGAVAYARTARDFTERIRVLVDSVDYRQAINDEEREAVYRLRYHGYLAEKAIAPNFGRRLSDKYDDLDNTWIFGVFIAGELASTIRLTIASAAHPASPALETFPDVLDAEIAADRIIVDPTRFVVDRRFSRLYPDLRYATTRLAWMACLHFSADLLLAAVRTEHQAFYNRVFGHRLISPARPFPMLSKPISLMACDFAQQRTAIDERYPFFRSTYFERRMLFEPSIAVRWQRTVEPVQRMVSALAV
jgi:N-acyl-L-homoserine lactone synthetase